LLAPLETELVVVVVALRADVVLTLAVFEAETLALPEMELVAAAVALPDALRSVVVVVGVAAAVSDAVIDALLEADILAERVHVAIMEGESDRVVDGERDALTGALREMVRDEPACEGERERLARRERDFVAVTVREREALTLSPRVCDRVVERERDELREELRVAAAGLLALALIDAEREVERLTLTDLDRDLDCVADSVTDGETEVEGGRTHASSTTAPSSPTPVDAPTAEKSLQTAPAPALT
jgi:hypothetical protein